MRLDQLSGWTLMALQVGALAVVTPALWAIGIAFQRSRGARWGSLLSAAALGAVIAAGILRSDETLVSSFLFAACLFLLGTVMMAVFLLAAIPATRLAALGAMLAGGILIVSFVLSYYVLFIVMPVRWLRPQV